jgi:branched-subunit amino acid ABC-type transport system permease component
VNNVLLLVEVGLIDGAILAISAVGFSMQFGVTNYANFAYASFISFGAFTAYYLDSQSFHVNFVLALVGAAIATAGLSFLIGTFVYTPFARRRPQLLYGLVVTFSMWLILDNVLTAKWGGQYYQLSYSSGGGSNVYRWGPFQITPNEVLFVVIAAVGLGCVHYLLRYTRLGRSMRAMADDRALALVCGLDTAAITRWTWIITGVLAGVAGFVQANHIRTFDTGIGDTYIYLVLAAVVLGGIGRPYGAVLGAVIIGLVSELSVPLIGAALSPVVIFAVLAVLMLYRPNGLFGATGRSHFGNA